MSTQRAYYRDTADAYDQMHERAEHLGALERATPYIAALQAKTLLDTGCGTGLALRYLERAVPGLQVHGNDPSPELLRVAVERYGVAADSVTCASSEDLPYGSDEFDVVVETGMLHHVPEPERVIREMLRVARLAIVISDNNYFGWGGLAARSAKLGLRGIGMLGAVNRARRGGHDWHFTEGDGVGWSYSVFDSLPTIRAACEDVIVLPTDPSKHPMAHACPILFARHCLVIGLLAPLPSPPAPG